MSLSFKRTGLRLTSLCVSPFFVFATFAGSGAHEIDPIGSRTETAVQSAQRFTSSRKLADFSTSIDQMQSAYVIDALTPDDFIADRRTLVKGWAVVLKGIESAYDPTFATDFAMACPMPPRNNDGTQGPPCSDPSTVEDPSSRATYLTKLTAFHAYLAAANHYGEVQRIDLRAMGSFEAILSQLRDVAPNNASSDFAALDRILQQAGIGAARRRTLDGYLFPEPTSP